MEIRENINKSSIRAVEGFDPAQHLDILNKQGAVYLPVKWKMQWMMLYCLANGITYSISEDELPRIIMPSGAVVVPAKVELRFNGEFVASGVADAVIRPTDSSYIAAYQRAATAAKGRCLENAGFFVPVSGYENGFSSTEDAFVAENGRFENPDNEGMKINEYYGNPADFPTDVSGNPNIDKLYPSVNNIRSYPAPATFGQQFGQPANSTPQQSSGQQFRSSAPTGQQFGQRTSTGQQQFSSPSVPSAQRVIQPAPIAPQQPVHQSEPSVSQNVQPAPLAPQPVHQPASEPQPAQPQFASGQPVMTFETAAAMPLPTPILSFRTFGELPTALLKQFESSQDSSVAEIARIIMEHNK